MLTVPHRPAPTRLTRGLVLCAAAGLLAAGWSLSCGGDEAGSPVSPTDDASVPDGTLADAPAVDSATSDASGQDAHASDAGDAGADADASDGARGDGDASADANADARSIWAFNGYCGPAFGTTCPAYTACASFDGGGIAAQDCDPPLARCLSLNAADSGLADRIFACEPTGSPVWDLNAVCDPAFGTSCVDGGYADCPAFEAGVAGQSCPTVLARCVSGTKIFACQPGGTLAWSFNGFCDAGPTGACPAYSTCPSFDGGGVAGQICAPELVRCLTGNKIFACALR